MIVEQRDYHVFTGKLPELVKLYETEGIALQQEHLGKLVGAFTTDVGALSTYTSSGPTRATGARGAARALQADERWKAFLGKIQPLIHTQQNRILVPTPSRRCADGRRSTARSRSSPAARRASEGDRRGPRARGRADRDRRSRARRGAAAAYDGGVGLTADVASEEDVAAAGGRGASSAAAASTSSSTTPASTRRSQMRPFDADPARGVAAGDGRERGLDVPDCAAPSCR